MSRTQNVMTYACAFGGPGKGALSLDNGGLRIDVDRDAANCGDDIRARVGDDL